MVNSPTQQKKFQIKLRLAKWSYYYRAIHFFTLNFWYCQNFIVFRYFLYPKTIRGQSEHSWLCPDMRPILFYTSQACRSCAFSRARFDQAKKHSFVQSCLYAALVKQYELHPLSSIAFIITRYLLPRHAFKFRFISSKASVRKLFSFRRLLMQF